MSCAPRTVIGISILLAGLCATKALDAASGSTRPELSRRLSSLPMTLGNWIGRDEPVDAEVVRAAQTDDYVNRVYRDPSRPGLALVLWMNYSRLGLNMRHSPDICLPGGGFTKLESQTQTFEIHREGSPLSITRLAYAKGELVQSIGFWYYIFGEGSVEKFVRKLPITSRGSHGRTTRGSAMTAEVFYPGDADPDGRALRDFTESLLPALESMLPKDRANYHIP